MALRKFTFAVVQQDDDPPAWGAWPEGTCPDATQAALLRVAMAAESASAPGIAAAAWVHWCDPELAAEWLRRALEVTEAAVNGVGFTYGVNAQYRALEHQWACFSNFLRALNVRPFSLRPYRQAWMDWNEAHPAPPQNLWGGSGVQSVAFATLNDENAAPTFASAMMLARGNPPFPRWLWRAPCVLAPSRSGGLWGTDTTAPTCIDWVPTPTAAQSFDLLRPILEWAASKSPLEVVMLAALDVNVQNGKLLVELYRRGRITDTSARQLATLLETQHAADLAQRRRDDQSSMAVGLAVAKAGAAIMGTAAGGSRLGLRTGTFIDTAFGVMFEVAEWLGGVFGEVGGYYRDELGRITAGPGLPAQETLAISSAVLSAPRGVMPPPPDGWSDPYVAPEPQVCCPSGQGRDASGQCVEAPLPDTSGGGGASLYYVAGMGLLVLAAGGFFWASSRRPGRR